MVAEPHNTDNERQIRVLVVDDEELVLWSVGEHLKRTGHDVECVGSGEAAIEATQTGPFDAVVLDVRLPGLDGIATLEVLLGSVDQLAVIMISAHSTVDTAVAAMKRGAVDFLVKPFSFKDLDEALERALALRRAQPEIARLNSQSASTSPTIVGVSTAMREIRELVQRIAAADAATVLIEGESGSGKEVVARALHENSSRVRQPFVQLNCSAVPEHLFESELFGHERGSFTDAHSRKLGLVEQATGGTLFLDEIADLSRGGQAKLLHLVENRAYRRVGGSAELKADVRIISATHASLQDRVTAGDFREDLFFRLNVVLIHVPPLRERSDDIPLLAGHLIGHFNKVMQRNVREISAPALDMLRWYPWPGNVRELRNVIERALILNPNEEVLRPEHLPPRLRSPSGIVLHEVAPGSQESNTTLANSEKRLIENVLERANGNQSMAAQQLGIGRDALRYRMKKYGLLD